MPEDIFELDESDYFLKHMLGVRFHDETEEVTAYPEEAEPEATNEPECKKVPERTEKASDAQWVPVKERTWMDNLWDCAKTAMMFGGLNMLIFYWQLNGLMDSSIAVPCMWVVCALLGLGIGKVVGGNR